MPRITLIHEDDDALRLTEKMSDPRCYYIESHKTVPLRIEMDCSEGWSSFHALPRLILPPLPPGYIWAVANNKYCVICETDAKNHKLLLVIYGPDKATKKINFVFQVDNKTTYSFAHVNKSGKGPRNPAPYPMTNKDYQVIGFDYKGHQYFSHIRGHCIDHRDTIMTASSPELWSTADPRNYVPEPPKYMWGLGFRNQKVQKLRRNPGDFAYAQRTAYPRNPSVTYNGTPVANDIKFLIYRVKKGGYSIEEIFNIDPDEDLSYPQDSKILDYAADHLAASPEVCPVVPIYSSQTPDRRLHKQSCALFSTARSIADDDIHSRFPKRDAMVATYESVNFEHDSARKRMLAASAFSENGEKSYSRSYARGALKRAENLSEFNGENEPPFTQEDHKIAKRLFRELGDDESLDRLQQLCRPA